MSIHDLYSHPYDRQLCIVSKQDRTPDGNALEAARKLVQPYDPGFDDMLAQLGWVASWPGHVEGVWEHQDVYCHRAQIARHFDETRGDIESTHCRKPTLRLECLTIADTGPSDTHRLPANKGSRKRYNRTGGKGDTLINNFVSGLAAPSIMDHIGGAGLSYFDPDDFVEDKATEHGENPDDSAKGRGTKGTGGPGPARQGRRLARAHVADGGQEDDARPTKWQRIETMRYHETDELETYLDLPPHTKHDIPPYAHPYDSAAETATASRGAGKAGGGREGTGGKHKSAEERRSFRLWDFAGGLDGGEPGECHIIEAGPDDLTNPHILASLQSPNGSVPYALTSSRFVSSSVAPPPPSSDPIVNVIGSITGFGWPRYDYTTRRQQITLKSCWPCSKAHVRCWLSTPRMTKDFSQRIAEWRRETGHVGSEGMDGVKAESHEAGLDVARSGRKSRAQSEWSPTDAPSKSYHGFRYPAEEDWRIKEVFYEWQPPKGDCPPGWARKHVYHAGCEPLDLQERIERFLAGED